MVTDISFQLLLPANFLQFHFWLFSSLLRRV